MSENKHTENKWTEGLTVRSANLLIAMGYTSKEEVKKALLTGVLRPYKEPAYIKRSHAEVLQWVGVDIADPGQPAQKTESRRCKRDLAATDKEASHALSLYNQGMDPALIEVSELAVFPHLIRAQPTTGRKSRVTGTLLGRAAPAFIKRGRSVRYRLKDVLDWLAAGESYSSTADVTVRSIQEGNELEQLRAEVAYLQARLAELTKDPRS